MNPFAGQKDISEGRCVASDGVQEENVWGHNDLRINGKLSDSGRPVSHIYSEVHRFTDSTSCLRRFRWSF